MPCLFIYKIKKLSSPRLITALGTRVIFTWCHPSSSTCFHIDLIGYGFKKRLYPSSISGAPVAASPLKDRCKAQRLASINNFYSFSAAGALCEKSIYLLFSS
jgi:hypothetical protein